MSSQNWNILCETDFIKKRPLYAIMEVFMRFKGPERSGDLQGPSAKLFHSLQVDIWKKYIRCIYNILLFCFIKTLESYATPQKCWFLSISGFLKNVQMLFMTLSDLLSTWDNITLSHNCTALYLLRQFISTQLVVSRHIAQLVKLL